MRRRRIPHSGIHATNRPNGIRTRWNLPGVREWSTRTDDSPEVGPPPPAKYVLRLSHVTIRRVIRSLRSKMGKRIHCGAKYSELSVSNSSNQIVTNAKTLPSYSPPQEVDNISRKIVVKKIHQQKGALAAISCVATALVAPGSAVAQDASQLSSRDSLTKESVFELSSGETKTVDASVLEDKQSVRVTVERSLRANLLAASNNTAPTCATAEHKRTFIKVQNDCPTPEARSSPVLRPVFGTG
ncbi:Hypothetical protein CpE19_1546 [Corynebacterium pseudotuberculosis]|nr:Hypothetical protein CpE19_1546 [Corynebacterium pseudotuberculosis]